MKHTVNSQQLNYLEAAIQIEYPDLDIAQISEMAKKVVEQFSGVRQKSKSIKKDSSVCSNSTNNTTLKNANSLLTTLNSTQASQINTSVNGSGSAQNALASNNNKNNLSVSSSTTASLSSIQKRVKFTPQEDEVILKYVQKHGKKWSEISKRLPGRTEVMVRNRYYVKVRKLNKEREGGAVDAMQNEDGTYIYAENSSQDLNNEQASDLFLGASQSAISKLNNSSSVQLQQIDEKQKSYKFENECNADKHFNQNSNTFASYTDHHLHNMENVFDSPIKQGIFDDDGLLHFNQNLALNNQMNSIDNFEQNANFHRLHSYEHKEQQHLFNSAVKEFPENAQNTNFYEQHLNQNNDYYDTTKDVLLQNQQYTQLPFQNNINGLQFSQDDDDFFEEANKPFKLPKLYIPEEDMSDISSILPPVGEMNMNELNGQIMNNFASNAGFNSASNGSKLDTVKQEKIQFLQNQISMIENMLNMCKDEIIREFAQRKSVSTNADSTKILNQTATTSSPLQQCMNSSSTKEEMQVSASNQQQQGEFFSRLQGMENQHFEDISMDIEEGSNKNHFIFGHEEHDLNAAENFNYHLNDQNQMITSLNNF